MDKTGGKLPLYFPNNTAKTNQLGPVYTPTPEYRKTTPMPISAIPAPNYLPSWIVSESIDFDSIIDIQM